MENEKKCTEEKDMKEPQIHLETDEEYAQRVSKINMQGIEDDEEEQATREIHLSGGVVWDIQKEEN